MNGPKRDLVGRLVLATTSMPRQQFMNIFPDLAAREVRSRTRNQVAATTQSIQQQLSNNLRYPAFPTRRVGRTTIQTVSSTNETAIADRPRRPRLESNLAFVLSPRQQEDGRPQSLEISIHHVVQVVPSPHPRRNSEEGAVSLTPSRRPRAASISSSEKLISMVPLEVSRTVQQTLECKVCMDTPIQTVLLPCGHACLCYDCSIRVQYAAFGASGCCPICRRRIQEVKNVYFA